MFRRQPPLIPQPYLLYFQLSKFSCSIFACGKNARRESNLPRKVLKKHMLLNRAARNPAHFPRISRELSPRGRIFRSMSKPRL